MINYPRFWMITDTPRQGDVVRQQFSAGNDTRNAEGGAPHRLRAVEGRVLKGRETDEPVDQARRQAGARDVEPVVGLKPDIRIALHRLGDQMGAETARESGGHRLGEECPDMPAITRARSF